MASTHNQEILVLLKLYDMVTAPAMQEARRWILSEFQVTDYESYRRQYPAGSPEQRRFTELCNLMELLGVLIKHGRVDESLFFDLFGGIDRLWDLVSPVVAGLRATSDPRLYENFEGLGEKARKWKGGELGGTGEEK